MLQSSLLSCIVKLHVGVTLLTFLAEPVLLTVLSHVFFLWFRAFKAMQKVSWDLSCACDFVFNLHVWCWRVSWGCSYLKGCEMNLLKLMYNWNGNKISKWIENVWNVLNWRNVHWPVSCVGRLRRVTWSAHVRYEGSTEHHLVVVQSSYRLLNAFNGFYLSLI